MVLLVSTSATPTHSTSIKLHIICLLCVKLFFCFDFKEERSMQRKHLPCWSEWLFSSLFFYHLNSAWYNKKCICIMYPFIYTCWPGLILLFVQSIFHLFQTQRILFYRLSKRKRSETYTQTNRNTKMKRNGWVGMCMYACVWPTAR